MDNLKFNYPLKNISLKHLQSLSVLVSWFLIVANFSWKLWQQIFIISTLSYVQAVNWFHEIFYIGTLLSELLVTSRKNYFFIKSGWIRVLATFLAFWPYFGLYQKLILEKRQLLHNILDSSVERVLLFCSDGPRFKPCQGQVLFFLDSFPFSNKLESLAWFWE